MLPRRAATTRAAAATTADSPLEIERRLALQISTIVRAYERASRVRAYRQGSANMMRCSCCGEESVWIWAEAIICVNGCVRFFIGRAPI